METSACMHFHLPHHSAWYPPQIVTIYIVKLIMLPLWLVIVIIFYFCLAIVKIDKTSFAIVAM